MSDIALAVTNPLLRKGIRSTLEEMEGVKVVAEPLDREEILECMARFEPDLLLMEAGYRRTEPGLMDQLGRDFPATAVMVLVDHGFDECVVRRFMEGSEGVRLSEDAMERLDDCCLGALRSNAKGCVPKVATPEEFSTAVRIVLSGQISAGPWIHALLSQTGLGIRGPESDAGGPGDPEAPLPRISGRELEVIELVAQGMGNKSIGKELGIHEQTVKNHLANIMEKVHVDNRLELALYAIKRHLVHP